MLISLFRPLRAGKIAQLTLYIEECGNITFLEHVVANMSFRYHRRGDLKITLISPSGTPSLLLNYRKKDDSNKGKFRQQKIRLIFNQFRILLAMTFFPFTSVHNWGENPIGKWTLLAECLAQEYSEYQGSDEDKSETEISYFALHFYGTYRREDKLESFRYKRSAPTRRAFTPEEREIERIYQREFESRKSPDLMEKREFEKILADRRTQQQKVEKKNENPTFFQRFKKAFGF